ncbi:polyphosphate--glucose phosphotransferase [Ilumatobacter coccineus]|uniref:Polyphosphate glucokinase n=1 Tax=Ilumatobacter coccineus (strain NBRC 103263 / KCTC 29153 / YM16-304) TaxID=1313172 RepID=A0A6C7EAP3_ILUCY|nr:ROK family protein [Ilumatobacter coccineus]BAN03403.1 polyphosphate glucokinase [Ilumatobacter coccineus YM16-304]
MTEHGAAAAFGIDIGGSGMKAAVVDITTGELLTDRFRIDTPKPATPDAMADVVVRLAAHHGWTGSVGCAFPAVVRNGVVGSAANIDESWLDVDADQVFTDALAADVHMINDADAAGLAEMRFGAGRERAGVVMVLTFGTGIGSGLFVDGMLVPNTELGHLELDGYDAEVRAAASARERDDLSWKKWAARVERYLQHVEALFSPNLFIVGGGASKRADKWLPEISIATEIVPAAMQNNAGIVGAALIAPK